MSACAERRGSVAGYTRHRRAGEDACTECATAKRDYSRKFWESNRDKQQEYRRKWDEKHPNYDREYYEVNRQKLLESAAKRRAENPQSWRLYPQTAKNGNARRRARINDATVLPIASSDMTLKWQYWGGHCWMCGGEASAWDHVKPLSAGGLHALGNLRPACKPCNSSKHARWPFDTSSWRGGRAQGHNSRHAA